MKAIHNTMRDYAGCGMTIQQAMVAHAREYPDKTKRPNYIYWNGQQITTVDVMRVACRGVVHAECMSSKGTIRQGFDITVDGWIELTDGRHVTRLRTWFQKEYEDVVEYPFMANDGILRVWNVYEMSYSGGAVVEERMTHNAGMFVESISANERIYHCSHGMASPPDFEALVFRIRIQDGNGE